MTEAEQQQKQIEDEKRLKELKSAYFRLFTTPDDGKMVHDDLRDFCGQDRSSVCASNPNPYQTFECEGKRRVFLRIDSMMKITEVKKSVRKRRKKNA